jgi:RimJ/RimL family protein N-acetyltransferase
MNEIVVRRATLDDLGTLLQFEQNIVSTERPFDETLKSGLIHYYDIEAMINASYVEVVVATFNNEIIGSGYARIETSKLYVVHQQHVYLGFMYVSPAHRGRGVNKKIIEALTQWALAQNITELQLDVYNENVTAIKAYEKIGFKKHMLQMRMGLSRE